jgi:hypothetical protein
MIRKTAGRLSVLAGASALALAAGWANANPVVVSTFDNSSSFVAEGTSFPTFGTYGLDNPGPPQVPNVRFDYGAATPTATWNTFFSPTHDNTGGSSGSLGVNWTWNHNADGDGSMAFTMDINSINAVKYTNLSFDIMVDPNSTFDTFGGIGYFQVFARGQSYNETDTGYNEELGNPTFSSPTAGTWEHISIPLTTPATENIRGLTFQLFNDTGRNINGPDTIYLDNIILTDTNVPEPASMGLLFAAGAVMLRRRRSV